MGGRVGGSDGYDKIHLYKLRRTHKRAVVAVATSATTTAATATATTTATTARLCVCV